ncbi:MAG: hypothetical protein LBR23_04790 [Spirochaetaceae bacterium]|nr:hypothetical protein [Spirochaetaceae bacterium]
MTGMYEAGIISRERMREFDEQCLVSEPAAAKPKRSAREDHGGRAQVTVPAHAAGGA